MTADDAETYAAVVSVGTEDISGRYEACPHVSGVVALALSYARKQGKTFTRDEFKNMILSSTNDIDQRISKQSSKIYQKVYISGTNRYYPAGKDLSLDSAFGTSSVNLTYLEVDVYLKFAGDGSFELYQMIGQGRFRYRSGSYSLSSSELSGKYSDGTAWSASYEVSLDGDSLKLSSIGSPLVETDSYIRCQIPQSVISEAVR